MDRDYAEVKRIFLEAAERNGALRARYLDEACAGDAALRAEVEALLVADAGPAVAFDQRVRVSGFTILRRIGEGGMGVVYEAEQENPRRRVALKLLKRGLADENRLRRFHYEAEVLGRLDHPGIARVYAAGVEEGQPWFAMELVRGVPLLTHAERLPPRGRIELLARICATVEHAHRNGIIHRDLKPGNILVDAQGEPRLLDFGIAKSVGPESAIATLATKPGEILGTVAYMSPEQVHGDHEAVDARADVYALGGIAYELLAGRRPLDLDAKPLADALHAVLMQEPRMLGTLDARWRGDIETIVAKALAKERNRRYDTAGELCADLQRFLHHEPISARPPSTIYQLGKFARRHRSLVAGLAAIFLMLVSGIVATTSYAVEASNQRVRFEQERDEARRQEQRANEAVEGQRRKVKTTEETLAFVVDVLYSGDPLHGPDLPKFSEILDRAAERTLKFEGEAEIQRQLAHVVGFVHANLGRHETARPLLELALRKAREIGDQKLIAHDLAHLGGTLQSLGEWDEARSLLDEAIAVARTTDEPSALALSLRNRGNLAVAEKDFAEAERRHLEAIEVAPRPWNRAASALALGAVALQLNQVEKAEEFTRMALEIAEKEHDPGDPRLAPVLAQRAMLLGRLGQADEAIGIYTRLIEMEGKRLGANHAGVLVLRMNRALAVHRAGRPHDAAEALASIAVDAAGALGGDHPQVSYVRYCLVAARVAAGEMDGLEPEARAAVDFTRKRFGERSTDTLNSLERLGRVLSHAGHNAEAADAYAQAARQSEGVPGLAPDFTVSCLHNATTHYLGADRAKDALPLAQDWVARKPSADAYLQLALALRTGDPAAAEAAARKGRELCVEAGGDPSATDALLAEMAAAREK